VPYHLLIDLARALLQLPVGGSELARADLDERAAAVLGDEARDATPYFASLMSLPLRAEEASHDRLDPEVLQGRYVAALHRVLRARTAAGPLVCVVEDIHWADPASIDVIRLLLPLATQLPVLFLGALRAETDSAGWSLLGAARDMFGQALTEIRLEPLGEADSRRLVANLLEVESLPASVRDHILARAEGNPFFVEEVVRMLIERGVIVAEGSHWIATDQVGTVAIPETLHGLLLARIDQLPEDAKRSLRVASVIGRQFPVRVLERLLDEGPEAGAAATGGSSAPTPGLAR